MNTAKQLVETIIKGIQEKKGENITVADLTHLDGAVTQYFVICQGNSPTQVEAIAGSIGDICRIELKEKPIHVVGLGTDQWVAIDFGDVIVHVFLPEVRAYYDLEHLWEDAKLTQIENVI
ncbi:MAG: ribosome silencing factor [Prevotella sp.]|jgi:ribosome-associated protein|nr:ribosome silencing factor [Prevotella sp.]